MPMRRCPKSWASLLALALGVAAPSPLGSNAGASAPGSRMRLRGPRRATNASSALQSVQPGAASNQVVRRLPAPTSLDRRRLNDYAQLAKLTGSDFAWPASSSYVAPRFGASVAIDSDTIVVGAHQDHVHGTASGSVFVFRTSDGATYDLVAKLAPGDGERRDYFGIHVAIDGDTLVISATGDEHGSSISDGTIYVFRTTDGGATYGQVAKLKADSGYVYNDFGSSVAVDGDTVVVGA